MSFDDTPAGDPAPACPTCARYAWMGRRRFLGMLGVGAAVAIAACDNTKMRAAERDRVATDIDNRDPAADDEHHRPSDDGLDGRAIDGATSG